MKKEKAVSFSLWGSEPMYNQGAIENAKLAQTHYAGWDCVFYLGDNVPNETISALSTFPNVRLISVKENKSPDWTGMFWRFVAIDEYDIAVFRDTDSRLSRRERLAVDEWLANDYALHIMRDHPEHSEPIMGGMWGVKSNAFMKEVSEKVNLSEGLNVKFADMMTSWQSTTKETLNAKGIDQLFLRTIYQMLRENALVHDSFPNFNSWSARHQTQSNPSKKGKEMSTGFPVRYTHMNDFVGQVFNENNAPVQEYADRLVEVVKFIDPTFELEQWKNE